MKNMRKDPNFRGTTPRPLSNTVYLNQLINDGYPYTICKESLFTIPYVIYAQKDFYLLDSINNRIKFLKAAGLVKYWHDRDVDLRFRNQGDSKVSKALQLHHLYGSFYILVCGAALGLFSFMIEILVSKFY